VINFYTATMFTFSFLTHHYW